MDKGQPDYLSYLLRLWRAENHEEAPDADEATWWASLESARTGEKRTFTNLDDLVSFLREQTGASSSHPTRQAKANTRIGGKE